MQAGRVGATVWGRSWKDGESCGLKLGVRLPAEMKRTAVQGSVSVPLGPATTDTGVQGNGPGILLWPLARRDPALGPSFTANIIISCI